MKKKMKNKICNKEVHKRKDENKRNCIGVLYRVISLINQSDVTASQ